MKRYPSMILIFPFPSLSLSFSLLKSTTKPSIPGNYLWYSNAWGLILYLEYKEKYIFNWLSQTSISAWTCKLLQYETYHCIPSHFQALTMISTCIVSGSHRCVQTLIVECTIAMMLENKAFWSFYERIKERLERNCSKIWFQQPKQSHLRGLVPSIVFVFHGFFLKSVVFVFHGFFLISDCQELFCIHLNVMS